MEVSHIINFKVLLFIATNCTVSIISGDVDHNRQSKRTTLTFQADNANATYTCRLDRRNFKQCKHIIMHIKCT